jgi:hypothetical protein
MEKEKFLIAPHMRLQEWVAEEKGYFTEEGLDFEYVDQLTKKKILNLMTLVTRLGPIKRLRTGALVT